MSAPTALTDHERAVLLTSLRMEAAIHDVPPAILREALLARTVTAFAADGWTDSEDFAAFCESRFRAMGPGFQLLNTVRP